jgi:hypothetical protein
MPGTQELFGFGKKLEDIEKKSSEREKVLKESLQSQKDLKRQIEARRKSFEGAMARSFNMTDSSRKGAKIEDYAGIDTEGNERGNETRDTFTGYLAALELFDPVAANLMYEKAAVLYENSDSGWLTIDNLLSYEHLMQDLGMQKYADQLQKYNLETSALGYAIGCLFVADTRLGGNLREKYKAYFLGELDKLTPQLRGGAGTQEAILSTLKVPKEFLLEHKYAIKVFEILARQAKELEVFFEFQFKDPKITALLKKKKSDISIDDMEEIEEVRKLILKEVLSQLNEKRRKLQRGLAAQLAEANSLYEEKEVTDELKVRLAKNQDIILSGVEVLNSIKYDENSTYKDLEEYSKKFREIRSVISAAASENFDIKKIIIGIREEKAVEGEAAAGVAGIGGAVIGGGIEGAVEEEAPPPEWTNAEPAASRFIRPKLKVSPHITDSGYRNNRGKVIGKLSASEPLIMVDINAKGKKFEDTVYIYVSRADGSKVWVDEAVLEYDPSELERIYRKKKEAKEEKEKAKEKKEEKPAPKEEKPEKKEKPKPKPKPKTKEELPPLRRSPFPLAEAFREHNMKLELENTYPFLKPVNLTYVWVLDRIARYGESPDGATFNYQYAGGMIRPRLRREGPNSYVLHTVVGDIRYRSLSEVLSDVNNGHVSRQLAELYMRNKEVYEPYKRQIGRVKVIEGSGRPGQFHMELDWRNPNADVYFTVRPHGIITFRVHRRNAGVYGEAERLGTAKSFNDFMIQLGYIRSWAEARKHRKTENLSSAREIENNAIADIYSFLNEEGKIGRVVAYKMNPDRGIHMALDWGGGNHEFSHSNARVRIDVDRDGLLVMSVNGHGVNTRYERFDNHTNLIRRLWDLRTWALKTYNFENPSV